MELRGPTLSLRFPVEADAPRLFDLGRDPEVTHWFSWGPYVTPDQPVRWIAGLPEARAAGRSLDYVIVHATHGVIGVTGLNELSVRDRRAMVGTWLGRPYWGSGANAESKALIAHLAFSLCKLERIGAYANPDNVRSSEALARLGFVREGTLRRWHRHGDRALDVHVFGLLREEWDAGALRLPRVAVVRAPPAPWIQS